ncbi:Pescadillo N-terminus-domain-containing protein [Boletus reticuloceps]|uniref:Pescadillo homolog n=1 Tax=Boletus reticuloceps TaxID=495285 RepID=A0A8I2Z0T7_9AGAM|nr:Pescadillo N-terminus-domain-containing protein [Boletus reticuloceps]
MGRLKQKGKAGAAKAYMTRSAAVKKLQCSLADFRRLCILKGIFPREPRSRKKANKGSTAPTSFYYTKDIAYLAHEPVLNKLREHKAFAKKISRALGRGEWSIAKNLEDCKPTYRLDHIIKERYHTFIDAIRDIDDALCMIFLFASLPSNDRVSPSLIANCSRLAAEWQLYVMHSRFPQEGLPLHQRNILPGRNHGPGCHLARTISVYAESKIVAVFYNVRGTENTAFRYHQTVDVRVMLTFLELYQTLLGFVFFKLYTDAGLVYPPPLDASRDDAGAGIGAFSVHTVEKNIHISKSDNVGKTASTREVRQAIKTITADQSFVDEDVDIDSRDFAPKPSEVDEEFVVHPSGGEDAIPSLPTLQSLSETRKSTPTSLFSPYTFFLSRETSRTVFEFLIKSFGGRVGWPTSSGSGSPITESDDSITHVIVDRPVINKANESAEEKERRRKRKYVQPQWVVDCINAGKILVEDLYAQGTTLPPHLSPFGGKPGAYDPTVGLSHSEEVLAEEVPESEDGQSSEQNEAEEGVGGVVETVNVRDVDGAESLRAAELAAEAAGMEYGTFEKEVRKLQRKREKKEKAVDQGEEDMGKMLLSNKKRKLYERMKYGEKRRAAEVRLNDLSAFRVSNPLAARNFAEETEGDRPKATW